MRTNVKTHGMWSGGFSVMMMFAVTLTAWAVFVTPCLGLPQSVPGKIVDLNTGVSQAELMKKLGEDGKVTTEPSQDNRGPIVTWNLTDSPYYENVSFRFTEKDRLFLIRFALKTSARDQYVALKEDFFGKYDFSPERPFRVRRKSEDILLYGPNSGATLFFLEFTNTKTGKKWYEVFNRTVSGEDRPLPPPEKEGKSSGQEQGTSAPESSKSGSEQAAGKESDGVKGPIGKTESKEPQNEKALEGKDEKPNPSANVSDNVPTPQIPQPKEGDKSLK